MHTHKRRGVFPIAALVFLSHTTPFNYPPALVCEWTNPSTSAFLLSSARSGGWLVVDLSLLSTGAFWKHPLQVDRTTRTDGVMYAYTIH